MSWKHLGESFDIHGGGIDLVFPHHENEIAQSRCAFHAPVMAKVWMHNGFLQVEGAKMSKSEGNFVTIRELLGDWPGEVLRLNMLRTHYRQPIDWTVKGLEESRRILQDWLTLAVPLSTGGAPYDAVPPRPIYPPLLEALCDDLNTPKAITEIHGLRNAIAHGIGDTSTVSLSDSLRFFGLLRDDVTAALDRMRPRRNVDGGQIENLIAAREAARKAKNFAEADRIRVELHSLGVVLKDSKDGTTWELA
jgi:cysteinyl-tRNA synthetase